MTKQMAAEELAARFDKLSALYWDKSERGQLKWNAGVHYGYGLAAKDVRAHLVPHWRAAPEVDGWYWCEELGADQPPQRISLHTLGTDTTGEDIQPTWKRWTAAGWVPLLGRVCPVGEWPKEAVGDE